MLDDQVQDKRVGKDGLTLGLLTLQLQVRRLKICHAGPVLIVCYGMGHCMTTKISRNATYDMALFGLGYCHLSLRDGK